MTTTDGPSHSTPSHVATAGRGRPIGCSPGTGILIGSWFVGAAITRLTGAVAVILLLAAAVIGALFEVVAAWWASRSPRRIEVVAPSLVEAGETVRLAVWATPSRRGAVPDRHLTICVDDTEISSSTDVSLATGTLDVDACFSVPGVVGELRVVNDTCGPLGLIWWRRSHHVVVTPIHVAPAPSAPLLTVTSSSTTRSGDSATGSASHRGDVDGIRPWRPGDGVESVHWPSTMRAQELIVHDRVVASEQHWEIDLSTQLPDPARLRHTLDEAIRYGHGVSVRDTDGTEHVVASHTEAAVWAAAIAQRAAAATTTESGPWGTRCGQLLRRPLRIARPESTGFRAVSRWSAGGAVLTAMAMLIGALDSTPFVLVLVAVGVVAGVLVSLHVAARQGTRPLWMKIAIAAAVVAALGAIAVEAADVDGLLAALRGPMPNLLMLLVVLHGFEVVDRRTLRVHQAIAFVVVTYAAGLRIDGSLGWWIAGWGVAIATSLLTIRPRVPRATDEPALHSRWSSRTVGHGVVSAGAFGVATVALLSVVPIPDGPARLGLPALSNDAPRADAPGALVGADGAPTPGSPSTDRGSTGDVVGYPGFTETLDTNLRGTLGDEIVMRVRSPQPAFWRGQTFSDFDGRTWTASTDIGTPTSGPTIDVAPSIGDALGTDIASEQLVQTYFVEEDLPNIVFAAYRPSQVIFDGTLWNRPDGALRSDVTLTQGSVYTVVSQRLQVTPSVLRSQGDVGEFFDGFAAAAGDEEIAPFLQLPSSTTQRTIDLATDLRAPNGSTYDTILRYQDWLAAHTEYDLDAPIPAEGSDAVDDFLFTSRRGFCEQIASTLTVMLRSQGVPARLATGYVSGERDRVSGVWKVRASDAHAWVEVWFPQTGWEAFDPTASVPLAGDVGTSTIGGDLIGATLSSIASHRVEIGALAVLVLAALAAVAAVAQWRHRRRRGRWGLLQDRFTALVPPAVPGARVPRNHRSDLPDPVPGAQGSRNHESVPLTNPEIARCLAGETGNAADIADLLDRAAFDPGWVDDDDTFERVHRGVALLERGR